MTSKITQKFQTFKICRYMYKSCHYIGYYLTCALLAPDSDRVRDRSAIVSLKQEVISLNKNMKIWCGDLGKY